MDTTDCPRTLRRRWAASTTTRNNTEPNMASTNIAPAYMQDLAQTEGANQATDYRRYMDEIQRQRQELIARRHHNSSLGQRAIRGLGGALKGGLMGAMTGNPIAAAGGAAAGFGGGM